MHARLPQVKWRRGEEGAEAQEEERVVSIVASLLNNIARGSRRERVAAKFVEAEFEKADRLVELYTRHAGRVRAEEASTRACLIRLSPAMCHCILCVLMTCGCCPQWHLYHHAHTRMQGMYDNDWLERGAAACCRLSLLQHVAFCPGERQVLRPCLLP
jgi:hypothetical protein